jgi:hypothetical protein
MPTSRDPTVPVDLTLTTPVGPQAHNIATIQDIDRVERLRYWRRADSAVGKLAVAYFYVLSFDTEDGYQLLPSGVYDSALDIFVSSIGTPFTLRATDDFISGLSFPYIFGFNASPPNAVPSNATLTIKTAAAGNVGGTVRIYAELNPVSVSSIWLNPTNKPGDAFARASTPTADFVVPAGGVHTLVVDVTLQMTELFASAGYDPSGGGYYNFWIEHAGVACDCTFGYAAGGANPAKLVITP